MTQQILYLIQIVKRVDYTDEGTFKSNYPSTSLPYPYHIYDIDYSSQYGVFILKEEERYLYGWFCGSRFNRDVIVFRGRTFDEDNPALFREGWFLLTPLGGQCIYIAGFENIEHYLHSTRIFVTNPLLDAGITKVSMVNTVYQFIDDDDIGREIRNESLLSVRVPA